MTNKELYAAWCPTQERMPIFMQPWWLDAVCAGKEWDVILMREGDKILAAMPYLIRKKLWMRYIIMPQQTQRMGIWIAQDIWEKGADDEARICMYMAQKLKDMKLHYYYQQYALNNPCVERMRMLGFSVQEHTTYRIEDLSDLDKVIASFSKNKRRQLQKALSLHAEWDMSAEEFFRFHTNCMLERHRRLSYSREFLLVLERKTRRLNQSTFLAIKNADGEVYAAAFLVWDHRQLYYLIPCYSEMHKESGASALLVLEAIKKTRDLGLMFDFEGGTRRGLARNYRQFGSTAAKYYSVSKVYKWWFHLALAYNWLRNFRYRI